MSDNQLPTDATAEATQAAVETADIAAAIPAAESSAPAEGSPPSPEVPSPEEHSPELPSATDSPAPGAVLTTPAPGAVPTTPAPGAVPTTPAPSVETVAVEPEPGDDPAPVATTEVVSASSEPAADTAQAVATEAAPEPATFRYQPGDIVPGTISVVGPNGIEADLGEGDLAVVPRSEIDGEPVVGDTIEGAVIKHQAGTGRYVISPKRAARARAWTRIVDAFENKTPLTGKVTDVTKGGLLVDLGIRAFLPESLIDVRKPANPRELVGTEVTVMVVEAEKLVGEVAAQERRGEKVVVNRRMLRETERKALRERLLSTLQPGDRMVGTVTALTDFGAFVDIGGAEGLVHVSELAHRNVAKPGDVVKVGQDLDVVVLEIKPDRNKISLSHKRTLPSPWDALQASSKVGDLVYGTVSGVAPFGAFVSVEGDGYVVEGLIHISELSRFRVDSATDVVAVGEGVWTKVLAIEPDKRRLSLSLRRALEE